MLLINSNGSEEIIFLFLWVRLRPPTWLVILQFRVTFWVCVCVSDVIINIRGMIHQDFEGNIDGGVMVYGSHINEICAIVTCRTFFTILIK